MLNSAQVYCGTQVKKACGKDDADNAALGREKTVARKKVEQKFAGGLL